MPSQFLSSSSVHLEAGITFGGTATARWKEAQMQQGGNEHFLWDLSTLSVDFYHGSVAKLSFSLEICCKSGFDSRISSTISTNIFEDASVDVNCFENNYSCFIEKNFMNKCKFSGRFRTSHVSKLVVLLWNWLFEKCWDIPSCSSEMLSQDQSFSMSF